MSISQFPTGLPGITYNIVRTTQNSTRKLTARSGLNYRSKNWTSPIYTYNLTYSVLRQGRNGLTELSTLFGFINQMAGQYQAFAFDDSYTPDDSVTTQQLGVGNGTQTVFPLVRSFGGYTDPVLLANTVSAVYLNGVLQGSGYTLTQIGSYGTDSITFASAPGNGVPVTASFTFFWVCSFDEDKYDFNQMYYQFFELKKISFSTLKNP